MNTRLAVVVGLCTAACLAVPGAAYAQAHRFTAQFLSGKRLDGAEVHDWHDSQADPRLDNQKLFFAGDRIRWIEDNSIPPAELPEAFVEFFGGDRLPGRVSEYRTGRESIFLASHPYLVVAPEAAIDWHETKRLAGLPVLARSLRRVVWQARDDERYRPGTLFQLDGRQIEFRALRWSKTSVRVLLEQETRDIPFDQIAELHLPRQNPWDAWFNQLAALMPDGSGTLVQIETGDGIRATASTARFSAATRGDTGNPDHWYHAIQPAWSLEPLWLRHRAIRSRRFFAPNEAPLSAIEPARAIQKSNLAGGWNWERDRNAHAWPLRCADNTFAWGFGVHAYSELGFDLPDSARTFRTQYGLDQVVGSGGCVRAAIFTGPATTEPVHRSGHVIGSAKWHDTGSLSVTGAKQLTLVVDPALDDRPAGADPFEIRDTFDWLHPLLELDSEELKAEFERLSDSSLGSLAGWTIVNGSLKNGDWLRANARKPEETSSREVPVPLFQPLKNGDWLRADARKPEETSSREVPVPLFQPKPYRVSIAWDQQRPPARRCRVEIAPREAFFAIERRLDIGERDRFLVLSVSRLEKDSGPSRIQIRFNGRAAAEFDVPVQAAPSDPDPLLVPVDRYRGKAVHVELVQIGQTPQARVEWRGIGLADRDPIVFEAFEDDEQFAGELAQGAGTVTLETGDKFSGVASLRVTPDDRNNPALSEWNLPIRGEPRLGEYRFVRFAWKKKEGKQIGLHLARNGAFAAALENDPKLTSRYHVGRGVKRDYGKSVQFRDKPPDQWELVTRDLFAEFGAFDATGLRLVAGDGQWAAFDHIYFARRPQDLDRVTQNVKTPAVDPLAGLPPDQKANVERIAVDPARFGEALGEVAPAFSVAASGQGVWLLKKFQGRERVVRTHPPEQGKPCILRSPIAVAADKHTELKLSVAPHPQSDWQLLVFANGEKLHDSLVTAATAPEGWADLSVDLSRFAGHNIVLEVHNHPNNWSNEFAYWGRVDFVTE